MFKSTECELKPLTIGTDRDTGRPIIVPRGKFAVVISPSGTIGTYGAPEDSTVTAKAEVEEPKTSVAPCLDAPEVARRYKCSVRQGTRILREITGGNDHPEARVMPSTA